jgi:hypothetical protein
MQAAELHWNDLAGWLGDPEQPLNADLVIYFGPRDMLANPAHRRALEARFPGAQMLGCSTGGQMVDGDVSDQVLTALALSFDRTNFRLTHAEVDTPSASHPAGQALGRALAAPDLAGVFLLSDGLNVNGSALVEGILDVVGPVVPISGGLAGDGDAFAETLVACNGAPRSRMVAAIGFYGDAIRFGHGSAGGWDVFGPKRKITRSDGNVLYEVDGKPALDLYRTYLGPAESLKLPGSALLFPMRISDPRHPERSVVRTVLAVDAEMGSMTFAGDMPGGWTAQLMRGSFGRLCAGAAEATHRAIEDLASAASGGGAAILVSCIGRRLLMGQRIDEEIEAAAAELPPGFPLVGFYSYGEISPHDASGHAQLHNQTMTVTLLSEKAA